MYSKLIIKEFERNIIERKQHLRQTLFSLVDKRFLRLTPPVPTISNTGDPVLVYLCLLLSIILGF